MCKKRKAETISVVELLKRISTEHKAVKWVESVVWEGGKPVCPHCGGMDNTSNAKSKKWTYWHKDCRKHFTVKTGSMMHGSKITTQNWVMAIYFVMTSRKSVSSLQLSKELGIQQRSAWYMLHRIREACQQGEFKLSAVVEVDETYIGGKEHNKHSNKKLRAGRGPVGKAADMGMRERSGKVRAISVERTDKPTLQGAIHKHIERGSVVYTDEHRAYMGLEGYDHSKVNHSAKEYVNGMAHTNGIESVWAVLKRGCTGTFHHISKKHLQKYVDEFAFRLNEGNCEIDTLDRMKSLVRGMGGKRLSYKGLIK